VWTGPKPRSNVDLANPSFHWLTHKIFGRILVTQRAKEISEVLTDRGGTLFRGTVVFLLNKAHLRKDILESPFLQRGNFFRRPLTSPTPHDSLRSVKQQDFGNPPLRYESQRPSQLAARLRLAKSFLREATSIQNRDVSSSNRELNSLAQHRCWDPTSISNQQHLKFTMKLGTQPHEVRIIESRPIGSSCLTSISRD
jgi:hypothetical protein